MRYNAAQPASDDNKNYDYDGKYPYEFCFRDFQFKVFCHVSS